MKEIENLKDMFIVNADEYNKQKIFSQVKKILDFCKLDSNGDIHFEFPDLTQIEKLMLFLIARYLGHELDSSIAPTVDVDDCKKTLGNVRREQVRSRLSELSSMNGAISVGENTGIYKVNPTQIDSFLSYMVKKKY